MIEKIYFYRKFTGSEFILSKSEKTVIPVRLKNQFIPDSFIFDTQKKSWQKASVIPEENEIFQHVEFVEFPLKPIAPCFTPLSKDCPLDIEDLSPAEMAEYYIYRNDQRRYFANARYYNDSNKICKDFFSAEIEADYEKLILRLSFTRFMRDTSGANSVSGISKASDTNLSLSIYSDIPSQEPLTSTDTFVFDMMKGLFSSNAVNPEKYNDYIEKTDKDYQKFHKLLNFLRTLELKTYPKAVLCEAYKKLCCLAQKYTGLKNIPTASDSLSKMKKNEETRFLSEMYILTKLPCEPKLYGILMNQEVHELKINFKYKRNDTKVLNNFLHKAHIKNYRILKKEYAENPLSLLTFRRLKDAGFRDLNLYNKVIQNQDFMEEINNAPRKALIFFLRYSLKHRAEIATLNTFLKTKDGFCNDEEIGETYLDKYDAMEMFQKYFRHIPKQLRKDILKDGFTTFNHDALANLTYRVKNKKITFKYSQIQQALEDDIDGYSFRLPKNSFQLCEIGTALHNCVASYAEKVSKNESTIVYVTKDDKYQICIEIQYNEIIQERTDRNAAPSSKEKIILQKWHERHGLKTNC